jgi:hypothetical protein
MQVIAGFLTILFLLILGKDVKQILKSGPTWLKKLVVAGLSIFGLFGHGHGRTTAQTWIQNPYVASAGETLKDTGEDGAELLKTWAEAEDVASGKRGPYPFDGNGKQALQQSLQKAKDRVSAMVGKGLLKKSEGDLLLMDLDELIVGVQHKRTIGMEGATCYKPMMIQPFTNSVKRIQTKIPLLEKLAGSKVSPIVLEKALTRLEADLDVVKNRDTQKTPNEKFDENEIKALEEKLSELLRQVRAQAGETGRLPDSSTPPTSNPGIQEVEAAFTANKALAEKPGGNTQQERLDAQERQKAAEKTIAALVTTGHLSGDEASLLNMEFAMVSAEITKGPPIDSNVKCYKMAYISPQKKSMGRLEQRLPLIEKLTGQQSLQTNVLKKLLAQVQKDLAVLADRDERSPLSAEEEAATKQVVEKTRALIEKLQSRTQ